MQEVERLCDRVVVVARGRDVATGTVDELRELTGESDFEEAFVRLAFGSSLNPLIRSAAPSQATVGGPSEERP
jgi:sodium transport system ATP-binding protein